MAKAELQLTNLDLYRAKFAEAVGTVCSLDEVRLRGEQFAGARTVESDSDLGKDSQATKVDALQFRG